MKRIHTMFTAVAACVVFAACSKDPPPPPAPTGPTAEEIARARADSIARAEAREDSIARAAARAEEEERERGIAAARETLREMVFFEYDQSALTSSAELTLRNKIDVLRASPAVHLRIEGHADERGSTEYNLALANARAEAVREFMVGFGLDPNRFSIVSYGEERPLVNASNESAWARNRRAEFAITAGENQISPVGN